MLRVVRFKISNNDSNKRNDRLVSLIVRFVTKPNSETKLYEIENGAPCLACSREILNHTPSRRPIPKHKGIDPQYHKFLIY